MVKKENGPVWSRDLSKIKLNFQGCQTIVSSLSHTGSSVISPVRFEMILSFYWLLSA